jgi:hypothetical protein
MGIFEIEVPKLGLFVGLHIKFAQVEDVCVEFDVLMAIAIKSGVVWNLTPCNLEGLNF